MPNPVTQSILKHIQDSALVSFVDYWDVLEALVTRVFRTRTVEEDDEVEFANIHPELLKLYARWQTDLEIYWRQSRIKGQAELTDPFVYLLQTNRAADFIGNWDAMKHLPAARESLNNYLLDQAAKGQ